MEKEKNDKVEPAKAPKEKKPLTEEQRIKRNKMIAIPVSYTHLDVYKRQDETPCLQEPSTIYPQPKENKPNVQT